MFSHIRQSNRTDLVCKIKVEHPSFGEILAETKGFSNDGVFIKHPKMAQLQLGETVTAQVQELPCEAPIVKMEVVRISSSGAGLRFCQE